MAPLPAFVPGAPVAARRALAGAPLGARRGGAVARGAVAMRLAPVSRRQALLRGAALLAALGAAPLAAPAKSGDSPKISVFGVGGASSPFDSGVQRGGKVQYKPFGEDEVAVFRRIVNDAKDRLVASVDSIKDKNWEDIRSQLRLQTDLRRTQLSVNANLPDKKSTERAAKAYQAFKSDIERLDQACVQKDQSAAFKAHNAAIKNLALWQEATGYY